MFLDRADVDAALVEPKPRLVLQFWQTGHEQNKNVARGIGEDHNCKFAEAFISDSDGLNACSDAHGPLLPAGW